MKKQIKFEGEHLTPDQLPKPAGWRVILAPIVIEETTAGGIVLVKEERDSQKHIRFVHKVLAMGPLCYKHDKFKEHPDAQRIEPWCQVGDIISTGSYTGATIPCIDDNGQRFELKIVNDDEISSVITDPSILNI